MSVWFTRKDFDLAVRRLSESLILEAAKHKLRAVCFNDYDVAILYATYMRATTEWDISEAEAIEKVADIIKETGQVPELPFRMI